MRATPKLRRWTLVVCVIMTPYFLACSRRAASHSTPIALAPHGPAAAEAPAPSTPSNAAPPESASAAQPTATPPKNQSPPQASSQASSQPRGAAAKAASSLSGIGVGGGGMGRGFGSGFGRLSGSHFAGGGVGGFGVANTENYLRLPETEFRAALTTPLSTFSADVDTASYSNTRRFLQQGSLPPADSVRVEEFINYFGYDDRALPGDVLSINTETASCPWQPQHRLVRLTLKAPPIAQAAVPARNLVFLLDVSGSMNSSDKLPLLKRGLGLLVENLRAQDKVSIVVYAGAAGLVLPPAAGDQRTTITRAIENLAAGGSTNGAEGILLAYQMARQNFAARGINRVILATDGDFNVGVTSDGELTRLVEQQRKTGVFLTVLGFGSGNLQDAKMEALADKGNGNYAYIDSVAEARKVLVQQAGATLVTVAKDVKLQVEFNPNRVSEYRLVGYENRRLANEDFNDDAKDAGEIGAGHSVTALYEVKPRAAPQPAANAPQPAPKSAVDPLRYQAAPQLSAAAELPELLTLKVRYKAPGSETSLVRSQVVRDGGTSLAHASAEFRFAAAVANFGLLLSQSKFAAQSSYSSVRQLAAAALATHATNSKPERAEFLTLVDKAATLQAQLSAAQSGEPAAYSRH